MRIMVVAVGQKVPDWAQTAWDDYAKRFVSEFKVELKTIKTEPRGTNAKNVQVLMQAESARIEQALHQAAKGSTPLLRVVLDERGKALRTTALAQRLSAWQQMGQDVAIIIGGPDGLDADFKATADEQIRLSDLTLPHAMVRVLLIEQLYRAWSVNTHHPYHRE